MTLFLHTLLVGIVATLCTDAWAELRARLFGVARPDYGRIGRWFAHLRRGRFRHDSIAAAEPVRGETALGWTAHYAIGVAFAAIPPGLAGDAWMRAPSLALALGVGLATVLAPWLLLQPGLGAGLAGRRTPHPWRTRGQSLLTHLVFGAGLYLGARLARVFLPF